MKYETQNLRELSQTMNALASAMVINLKPLMEAITGASKQIYAACLDAYNEAGAPYGNSHKGMMRWTREVAAIARFESEANRLRQHHELIANLRKRLRLHATGEQP